MKTYKHEMIRISILILILIAPLDAYGQFFESAKLGVEYSYQMNNDIGNSDDVFDVDTDNGSKIGLFIMGPVGELSSVRVGLNYTGLNSDVRDYRVSFGCDHDGMGGFDQYNSWIDHENRSNYLGIDLDYIKYLGDQKEGCYLNIGLAPKFLVSQSQDEEVFECGMGTSNHGPRPTLSEMTPY